MRSRSRVVAAHDLNPSMWIMAELIEAAVRAGTPEVAADARGSSGDRSGKPH